MADKMDKSLLKKIKALPSDDKKELIEYIRNSLVIEKYPVILIEDRYQQLLEAAESTFGRKMQKGRDIDDVMMRRFIAYKLREDGYTYSQISRVMGKNHSTIIHLIYQMEDYFELPKMYKEDIKKYFKFHSTIIQNEGNGNN